VLEGNALRCLDLAANIIETNIIERRLGCFLTPHMGAQLSALCGKLRHQRQTARQCAPQSVTQPGTRVPAEFDDSQLDGW
jgi:hypothetical protein